MLYAEFDVKRHGYVITSYIILYSCSRCLIMAGKLFIMYHQESVHGSEWDRHCVDFPAHPPQGSKRGSTSVNVSGKSVINAICHELFPNHQCVNFTFLHRKWYHNLVTICVVIAIRTYFLSLHYDDFTWTSWRLKSPIIRLFNSLSGPT